MAIQTPKYSAKFVADSFVPWYYTNLYYHPEKAHRFYLEHSLLCWPGLDDAVTTVTTMQGIHKKIMSSGFKDFYRVIETVDAQESLGGGFILLVTGWLGKDDLQKNFSQTFFLVEQERFFYILNDVLKFFDVYESVSSVDHHDDEGNNQEDATSTGLCNLPYGMKKRILDTITKYGRDSLQNMTYEDGCSFGFVDLKSAGSARKVLTDRDFNSPDLSAYEDEMEIQTPKYSAKFVADSFVPWYYTNLYYHPEKAHRFYLEHSLLCWPGLDDAVTTVTTMQGIHKKIMSSGFKDFYRVIETVDAQESLGGGFILLVTGWLGKDDLQKNFSQTFFLAEQERFFYILNDVLKFFDVYESVSSVDHHDDEGNNQEDATSTGLCNLPYGMKKRILDTITKYGRDSLQNMTYEDGCSFGFVDLKSAGSARKVLTDRDFNSPDLSAYEDEMEIQTPKYSAKFVADSFVPWYYTNLYYHPEKAHRFYLEHSLLCWPGLDDAVTTVTTMQGIHKKIMSSGFKDFYRVIETVDAQESLGGGFILLVTGWLGKDDLQKNFSQTFFLAEQERFFYILNDVLKFFDVYESVSSVDHHDDEGNNQEDATSTGLCNLPYGMKKRILDTITKYGRDSLQNMTYEDGCSFGFVDLKSAGSARKVLTDRDFNSPDLSAYEDEMEIQTPKYSAKFVADSFVPWYYTNLYYHPEKAHRFYLEHSLLCWPGLDDAVTTVTTMQGIHKKIMSSGFKDFYRVIETVDAQESLGGGFILLVTGWLGKDDLQKNFSQTFFLAEQERFFYILNDVLKFFDVYESVSSVDHHDDEGNNQEDATSTGLCNLPYGMKKRILDTITKYGRDSLQNMTYEDGCSFGFVDLKSAGSARKVLTDRDFNSPDLSAYEDEMEIQTPKYSAKFVADSFVPWYYTNLYYHPEKAHRFYLEHSLLCWPGLDDAVTTVTTMQGIHKKIMSSGFKDFYRVIETVDAQESLGGGFILLVTGWLGKDDLQKNFSQTFFLAEQERFFYILNDVLKFFDVYESVSSVDHHDDEGNNQEDATSTGLCNLPYGMKKRILDTITKYGRDSLQNMTYEDGCSFGFVDLKSAGSARKVLTDRDFNSPDLSAYEDAMSIYIGNLPHGITKKEIKEVIKKFGRVKSGSDSIQIRCGNGSAYGFVDFVSASSARRAVEAHCVTFGEKESYIAYKRLFNGGRNSQEKLPGGDGFPQCNAGGSESVEVDSYIKSQDAGRKSI